LPALRQHAPIAPPNPPIKNNVSLHYPLEINPKSNSKSEKWKDAKKLELIPESAFLLFGECEGSKKEGENW
jgi:hypothetical protein